MSQRRSSVTSDEYFYERVDETTVKYTPPAPRQQPQQQQQSPHFCCMHVCDTAAARAPAPAPAPAIRSKSPSFTTCVHIHHTHETPEPAAPQSPLPKRIPLPVPACPAHNEELQAEARRPRSQSRGRSQSRPSMRSSFSSSRRGSNDSQVSHEATVCLRYDRMCEEEKNAAAAQAPARCSRPGNSHSYSSDRSASSNVNKSSNYDYKYEFNETKTVTTKAAAAPAPAPVSRSEQRMSIKPNESSFVCSRSTSNDRDSGNYGGNYGSNNNRSSFERNSPSTGSNTSLKWSYESQQGDETPKRVTFSHQYSDEPSRSESRGGSKGYGSGSEDEEQCCFKRAAKQQQQQQQQQQQALATRAPSHPTRSQELASTEAPFACHAKEFFEGEMRNFFVNNDSITWHSGPNPHDFHLKLRNFF